MRTYISITDDGVVTAAVEAETAVGFFVSPRRSIKIGDTLTSDEKIFLGLESAPDGYIPPSSFELPEIIPPPTDTAPVEVVEEPS